MMEITIGTNVICDNIREQVICCVNCVQPCSRPISEVRQVKDFDEVQTTTTTTINVLSSLASIFKLDYHPKFNLIEDDKDHLGLCNDCTLVLVSLSEFYDKFNGLRQENSYLSKTIQELDEIIFDLLTHHHKPNQQNPITIIGISEGDEIGQNIDDDDDYDENNVEESLSPNLVKNCRSSSSCPQNPQTLIVNLNPIVKIKRLTEEEIISAARGINCDHHKIKKEQQQACRKTRRRIKIKKELDGEDSNNNSPSSTTLETSSPKKKTRRKLDGYPEQVDTSSSTADSGDSKKKMFCKICGTAFSHDPSLEHHLRKAHQFDPFQCTPCSKTFPNRTTMRIHLKEIRHHSYSATSSMAEWFKCTKCRKFLPTLDHLKTHQLSPCHREWKPNPVTCIICSKTFYSSSYLKIHKKNAHADPALSSDQQRAHCTICDKYYKSAKGLKDHEVYLHGPTKMSVPEPHPCPICSKIFSYSHNMRRHMKDVHEMGNSYCCHYCGLQVTTETGLKRHLLIHTDRKSFKCPDCDKRFQSKFQCNAHHESIHEGKVYLCSLCGRQFRHKNNLRRHALVHSDNKDFSCDLCGQRFKSRDGLNQHMRQPNVHSKSVPIDNE